MASEARIQTYSSLREKRKRIIHSEDVSFPTQDEIIRKFPESGRLGITEADKILQGWMNLPVWSIGKAISDVEDLKIKHERNNRLVLEHEEALTYLLKENIEMKKEIQELKLQLSNKKDLEELWQISDQNVKFLDDIFDLNDLDVGSSKLALDGLKGILKDCKCNGINSDDLVRSIRGE